MSRPDHMLDLVLQALRVEGAQLELPGHLPSAVMERLERGEADLGTPMFERRGGDPLRIDPLETAEEVLVEAHLGELDRVDFARFAAEVRVRLAAEPVPGAADEADRLALAPEVDPELGGRPVGELLRGDSSAVMADPAMSWDGFGAEVLDRIARAPTDEEVGALAPDRAEVEGPSVGELLRAERDDELRRREGSWGAFRSAIETRIAESPTTEALDDRAVALLRADVEDELRALGPAFEERFKEEVGRRISERDASRRSSWARTRAWLAERMPSIDVGWGVGLAGVAAALALVLGPSPEPRPDPAAGARAELSGEVSVDAVTFEGDVMMIPGDGMTVVVLSGV